jgi:hypothetical protein
VKAALVANLEAALAIARALPDDGNPVDPVDPKPEEPATSGVDYSQFPPDVRGSPYGDGFPRPLPAGFDMAAWAKHWNRSDPSTVDNQGRTIQPSGPDPRIGRTQIGVGEESILNLPASLTVVAADDSLWTLTFFGNTQQQVSASTNGQPIGQGHQFAGTHTIRFEAGPSRNVRVDVGTRPA